MPKVIVDSTKGLYQQSGIAKSDFKTGLGMGAQALAAAGANAGNSTPIVATDGSVVVVSGANGTTGVTLPALSSVPVGTFFIIANTAGAVLKVWPNTDDKVNPLADDAHVTVAANCTLILTKDSNVQWLGGEPAVISE